MPAIRSLLLILLPVACGSAATPPASDLKSRQETACTAIIAEHVGRPVTEIRARWLSETNGVAQVETMDSNRRHICRLDDQARVLDYIHPPA